MPAYHRDMLDDIGRKHQSKLASANGMAQTSPSRTDPSRFSTQNRIASSLIVQSLHLGQTELAQQAQIGSGGSSDVQRDGGSWDASSASSRANRVPPAREPPVRRFDTRLDRIGVAVHQFSDLRVGCLTVMMQGEPSE